MIARLLALALGCALMAGCAGNRTFGASPTVDLVAGDTLPPPTRGDLFAADRPYLIGPFDKLTIDVFGIDELSKRVVQTDAGGNISFPLIGVVEAAGKTPGELAGLIEQRLRGRFIRDPQVTINLEDTVSQVVTVDGQVARPGRYPVVGKLTLIRTVATAGGTGEFAKLDDVVIFRTVNGQEYAALYNLKAIRQGNYPDPEIYANDVVVVGDSKARRLFKDVISASGLFVSPLLVLLRR